MSVVEFEESDLVVVVVRCKDLFFLSDASGERESERERERERVKKCNSDVDVCLLFFLSLSLTHTHTLSRFESTYSQV